MLRGNAARGEARPHTALTHPPGPRSSPVENTGEAIILIGAACSKKLCSELFVLVPERRNHPAQRLGLTRARAARAGLRRSPRNGRIVVLHPTVEDSPELRAGRRCVSWQMSWVGTPATTHAHPVTQAHRHTHKDALPVLLFFNCNTCWARCRPPRFLMLVLSSWGNDIPRHVGTDLGRGILPAHGPSTVL